MLISQLVHLLQKSFSIAKLKMCFILIQLNKNGKVITQMKTLTSQKEQIMDLDKLYSEMSEKITSRLLLFLAVEQILEWSAGS